MLRFIVLLCALGHTTASLARSQPIWVYQSGPINAVMQGLFTGTVSCKELLHQGNLGLGTFDALDGEMIVVDGQVYQAREDGSVVRKKECLSPFAVLSELPEDVAVNELKDLTRDSFEQKLTELSSNLNGIDVIRLDGEFTSLSLRIAPKQKKPYPKLADAVKTQPVFSFGSIKGTIVGFRFPAYTNSLNVSGYHLHFISDDRRHGGHVFDFSLKSGKLRMQGAAGLKMAIPQDKSFAKTILTPHSDEEMKKVESQRK
jgi:acetolactate decarboxylase